MAKRLIINADDFGLTRGVNRSIRELATRNALTSATLMANSGSFQDAVEIACSTPSLGVGCHVVLTDGIPVCAPEQIPTLIGKDGRSFRASLKDFWLATIRGRVDEEDVRREATAQIQKLQSAGIQVTHLDSHKHTHILPRIAAPLLAVAEELGVPAIRNPFESPWSLALSHGNIVRRLQVRWMRLFRSRFQALAQIRDGTVTTTSGTIGVSATGRLDKGMLRALLDHIPEGTWELVCHPGYNDPDLDAITTRLRESREVEQEALIDALTGTSSHLFGIELIHYGMLAADKNRRVDSPSAQRAVRA